MAFYTLGLTFELVILLTVIVLGMWVYGIYFNVKKWGIGSTGYHDQLRYRLLALHSHLASRGLQG